MLNFISMLAIGSTAEYCCMEMEMEMIEANFRIMHKLEIYPIKYTIQKLVNDIR